MAFAETNYKSIMLCDVPLEPKTRFGVNAPSKPSDPPFVPSGALKSKAGLPPASDRARHHYPRKPSKYSSNYRRLLRQLSEKNKERTVEAMSLASIPPRWGGSLASYDADRDGDGASSTLGFMSERGSVRSMSTRNRHMNVDMSGRKQTVDIPVAQDQIGQADTGLGPDRSEGGRDKGKVRQVFGSMTDRRGLSHKAAMRLALESSESKVKVKSAAKRKSPHQLTPEHVASVAEADADAKAGSKRFNFDLDGDESGRSGKERERERERVKVKSTKPPLVPKLNLGSVATATATASGNEYDYEYEYDYDDGMYIEEGWKRKGEWEEKEKGKGKGKEKEREGEGEKREEDPGVSLSSLMSLSMASKKPKKPERPAWALSTKRIEEMQEAEVDALLDFIDKFDIDKYLDDIEVQDALLALRERVGDLERKRREKREKRKEKEREREREREEQRKEDTMVARDGKEEKDKEKEKERVALTRMNMNAHLLSGDGMSEADSLRSSRRERILTARREAYLRHLKSKLLKKKEKEVSVESEETVEDVEDDRRSMASRILMAARAGIPMPLPPRHPNTTQAQRNQNKNTDEWVRESGLPSSRFGTVHSVSSVKHVLSQQQQQQQAQAQLHQSEDKVDYDQRNRVLGAEARGKRTQFLSSAGVSELLSDEGLRQSLRKRKEYEKKKT